MQDNHTKFDKQVRLPAKLFQFLEENVSMHKDLLAIIGKEREYLFRSSVEDLFPSTSAKEGLLTKITDLEKRLRDFASSILPPDNREGDATTFSRLVDLSHARQKEVLRNYLTILRALKKEIERSNSRNKEYIEERLTLIREAMSLLLPDSKAPFYTARGWGKQCTCTLRKEI